MAELEKITESQQKNIQLSTCHPTLKNLSMTMDEYVKASFELRTIMDQLQEQAQQMMQQQQKRGNMKR